MKQISSEITGALSRVQQAVSQTGQQPGGTGVVTEDQARAWLVGRDPAATDKALRTSLQSSLNVEVEPVFEWRYPPDNPAYRVAKGCQVGGIGANLPAAFRKVEAAMAPPTTEQAENWLAMLQAATAGGRKSQEAAMLTLALYTGALKRFPADVALKACEELAVRCSWFPTLGEIVAECERYASPRQAMLTSIEAAMIRYQSA